MRIDTTQITGYADMSVEEKLAALEAYEYSDNSDELEKLKTSVSKANSQAADYKRQLKEATANLGKATEESNSELTAIKEQLAALQREKAISENTASFIAQGYDKALAIDSATALMDGDSAKLFANMQKFMADHDKAVQAQLVRSTERPSIGIGNPDASVDWAKKIADAQAANDYSAAAYYMRLQQEQTAKK